MTFRSAWSDIYPSAHPLTPPNHPANAALFAFISYHSILSHLKLSLDNLRFSVYPRASGNFKLVIKSLNQDMYLRACVWSTASFFRKFRRLVLGQINVTCCKARRIVKHLHQLYGCISGIIVDIFAKMFLEIWHSEAIVREMFRRVFHSWYF